MISVDTGFTPDEMYRMLYTPFEIGCPVQLRTLTDEQVEQIPFMHQVLHLMNMLSAGELKLTAKGYIPPKIVEDLYLMGTRSWNTDWFKQKSEPKTEEIQVLRVVLKECGLVKTRIGKMSLTSKGKKLLSHYGSCIIMVMCGGIQISIQQSMPRRSRRWMITVPMAIGYSIGYSI